MTGKYFIPLILASIVFLPAISGAVEMHNLDSLRYTVTVIEDGNLRKFVIEHGSTKRKICSRLCDVFLENGKRAEPAGTEVVIIQNGHLRVTPK